MNYIFIFLPGRNELISDPMDHAFFFLFFFKLTEAKWCINASPNLGIIASNNGMSPFLRQAIIWTSASLLPVRLWWTYFSEIWIIIPQFLLNKIGFKMCAKWQPFCHGFNVLIPGHGIYTVWLLCKLLTHWGLVTQNGDRDVGQHWLR